MAVQIQGNGAAVFIVGILLPRNRHVLFQPQGLAILRVRKHFCQCLFHRRRLCRFLQRVRCRSPLRKSSRRKQAQQHTCRQNCRQSLFCPFHVVPPFLNCAPAPLLSVVIVFCLQKTEVCRHTWHPYCITLSQYFQEGTSTQSTYAFRSSSLARASSLAYTPSICHSLVYSSRRSAGSQPTRLFSPSRIWRASLSSATSR